MKKQNTSSSEEIRTEQKQNQPTTMLSGSSESKGDNVNCFECKAVEETPFYVTRVDDERIGSGFIILFAGLPASKEIFETREAAKEYIHQKPWDLITSVALGIVMKNNTNPLKIK